MVQESTIAGVPLKLPQLDIDPVGAGGGSIAWVDIDGRLGVGAPERGCRNPGPALLWPWGHRIVTVTDANLLLGHLSTDTLLSPENSGSIGNSRSAPSRNSRSAAGTRTPIGSRKASSGLRLLGIRTAIRPPSIERGHDPRAFCLIPLGGAGPLHAAELARELGISKVSMPRFPGNLSLVGLISSDIRHDFARTVWLDARCNESTRTGSPHGRHDGRRAPSLRA